MTNVDSTKESWYRTWFNSPYYHLLYRNRDENEANSFIANLVSYLKPEKEAHFLDLACGQGRHSRTINKFGFEVTGADLAAENIRLANQHSSETLRFIQHDMRDFIGKEKFEYIVNLFTSFGYFKRLEENENVIKAIAQALKPEGRIVLDFMNVDKVIRGLVPVENREINGVKFKIEREFKDGFIVKNIDIVDNNLVHSFHEHVKALTLKNFKDMFARNGLRLVDTFGDYELKKFDINRSSRLILIGEKTSNTRRAKRYPRYA